MHVYQGASKTCAIRRVADMLTRYEGGGCSCSHYRVALWPARMQET